MTTKAWSPGSGPSLWRALFPRRQSNSPHDRVPGALLWDMDGLLVDSEPIWTVAERELFAGWGVTFTPVMKAALVGQRMDTAVAQMIELGGPGAAGADPATTRSWLLARMVELFAAGIPLLPGVGELLGEAAAAGIPQALVSSSYRVLVDAVLTGLPGHPFVATLAGDEVSHGKPHPEPYLTAAARLGVPITRCVVIEDSPAGARSGTAAGAHVIYCPSVPDAGEPEPGWRPVRSLSEVSVEGIRAWLSPT